MTDVRMLISHKKKIIDPKLKKFLLQLEMGKRFRYNDPIGLLHTKPFIIIREMYCTRENQILPWRAAKV